MHWPVVSLSINYHWLQEKTSLMRTEWYISMCLAISHWESNNFHYQKIYYFAFFTKTDQSSFSFSNFWEAWLKWRVRVSSYIFVILWSSTDSLVEISFSPHVGFSEEGSERLEQKPYPSLVFMIIQGKYISNVLEYHIILEFHNTRKFNYVYFKTFLWIQNGKGYLQNWMVKFYKV